MARGRMLNQKIAEDLEFNCMSMEAQFLFMRTLPFLDRDGLVNGHPVLLAGKVVSLIPSIGVKAAELIDEWVDNGFVIRYNDGKAIVLFFKNFSDNQIGMRYDRETKSDYAPPPGYKRTDKGLVLIEDGNSTDAQKPDETDNENDDAYDGEQSADDESELHECGTLPDDCRKIDGSSPPERELEIELKDQHAHVAEPEKKKIDDDSDDLMPGQYLRSLIEGKGFMYLDQNFTELAMKLESQYSQPELVQALEQTHKYHLKKIGKGQRGITAPLAYMSQVLSGSVGDDGEQQPSKAKAMAQRMREGKRMTANDYYRNGRKQDGIGYVPGTALAFLKDYEGPPA